MLDPKHKAPFRLSRRGFLHGLLVGGSVAFAQGLPVRAFASESITPDRTLSLVNTHTGEELTTEFFRAGSYADESLTALNHLLRDYRTGDVAPIDPRLFDLLHDMARLADREPRFEVISGYRSPATNAMLNARSSGVARQSLHMQGQAIDIRLAGYRTDRLRDLALSMRSGGVGFYRKSDFIHVDTGRVRTWAG
jgi:uncharacterized protein YcbK (DUF882 family)